MEKLISSLRFFAVSAAVAAAVIISSPPKAEANVRVQCGAGVTNTCGSTCTATNWYGGCTQWRNDYNYSG